MVKTLLIALLLFFETSVQDSATVYTCSGIKGKYHLRADCRGLNRCQHRIIKMKLSVAEKEGRTLCGFEKKKS